MAGFWRQPQQAEYLPEDFKPLDYSRKDSWHACYAQDGGRNLTAWVPTVRLTCNNGGRGTDQATWGEEPAGVRDTQSSALADLFYVHPTTALQGTGNAEPDESVVFNGRSYTQAVLQRHCAAFNGSCRIYAPKYQQARLGNYVVHGSDWGSADSWLSALVPIDMCALTKSDKPETRGRGARRGLRRTQSPDHRTEVDAPAFNGAYEDVRSAFFYYLQHWNQGRPFILAGHSQGSQHLVRLIQELETLHETSVLLDRLVAAYLIGCAVGRNTFKLLPLSPSPTFTPCFITYQTVAAGKRRAFSSSRPCYSFQSYTAGVQDPTVVNPLTWTATYSYVNEKTHSGCLDPYGRLVANAVGTCCSRDGVVEMHPQPVPGFTAAALRNRNGDYHVSDYAMFWMNLRINALQRVEAWITKHADKTRSIAGMRLS